MTFTQVKPFDQSKGGTTPNMCLANVIRGYQIPPKYPDAWTAWENTEQHSGDPPSGLDVPVYFSYFATIDDEYKNWGHIGVRLSNGQFWSDGKVYNSIGDYTSNHSPKYVGWGESINNVTVIQEGDDMRLPSKDEVNAIYIVCCGRSATQTEINNYTQHSFDTCFLEVYNSQESINWVKTSEAAVKDGTTLKPGKYIVG